MQATPIDRCIPLPQHWHRHVRSAIVHAVSMATITFTHAVARAADSPDTQIRAQAEIDRLQREVDLFREEARIKDARMERLPARAGRTIRRASDSRFWNCVPRGPGRRQKPRDASSLRR